MAPARGGDRTDRRHRCPVPTGRLLAVLGATVLAVGVAGTAPRAAAGTARASGTTLSLLAPPTVAGPGSPFDVRLGVSGPVAPTGLTVGVTVYAHLLDLTQFDETLDGSPVGSVVASSDAIPVSSLPADPQGGVDLTVPVTAGGVTGAGTGPFTADLTCQLGSCGGVYPVELVLTDTATGTVTARLLTYLVYTDPAGRHRAAALRPRGAPGPGVPTGRPPGRHRRPCPSLGGLIAVESALSGPRASVPLTVIPGPATVEALGGDRSERARTALSSLVSLTTDPGRQTLCGPFVPVDASALVSATSGGITELAEQVRRGAQVLGAVPGLHAGDCATGEGWVADGTLDTAALDALGSLGFSDMVIPPGAVTGPPSSTTPTRRFTLSGAPHAVTAILSDPGLSDLLRSPARGGPALAADQILAELEFDYYEAQNTPAPRGVVAAPPTTAGVDPAVVADLLDGLQNNPMVEPVTLATLFSDVPVGGTVGRFTQPSSRRPAGVGNATGLPGPAIAAARAQWTGFSAAVSGSRGRRGGGRRPRRPAARGRIATARTGPATRRRGALRGRLPPPAGPALDHLTRGPSDGEDGQRPHHRDQERPVPRRGRPHRDQRQDRLLGRQRPGPEHRVPDTGRHELGRAVRACRRCARSSTGPTPSTSRCARGCRAISGCRSP